MASVYTVSQVNAYIRGMFAQDPALMRITVRGEVSNCKYHSTGHIYFTLKDSGGETISAVMFVSRRSGLSFRLEDGQQVEVTGSIEVYVRNGTYSLYAMKIEHAGQGELYERFLKLKEKLGDMGLFDPMYKQPIPRYVRTVGVVTTSTGAAIRDIINISSRRNPYVQLYLCPAQVQGHGAAESIARAIRTLDAYGLDVMIVGRGGGSLEDLWAFNEEIVAKAIFDARTPIISAVGHETDTTIADFVADLRAPTPSAAAELAVYDVRQLMTDVESRTAALKDAEAALVGGARDAAILRADKLALLSPGRRLNELRRRQDDARSRLVTGMRARLAEISYRRDGAERLTRSMRDRLEAIKHRQVTSEQLSKLMHKRLSEARDRQSRSGASQLNQSMTSRIKDSRHALALAAERMKAVSPLEKLTAGYVWVSGADGEHIRSAAQVHAGDEIDLRWADGRARAQVTQTQASGE
jgi:exodeoxyribonuclease VII large subunit